jgi:CheY-like chemotaxis protein
MNLERQRLLLIEFSTELRLVLSRHLNARGFSVIEVKDGASARQWIAKGDADVIVVDQTLPRGEDGFDLVAEIRERRRGHSIPVVVLTNSTPDGELVAKAERLGHVHLMQKPPEPEVLLETLQRILGVTASAHGAFSSSDSEKTQRYESGKESGRYAQADSSNPSWHERIERPQRRPSSPRIEGSRRRQSGMRLENTKRPPSQPVVTRPQEKNQTPAAVHRPSVAEPQSSAVRSNQGGKLRAEYDRLIGADYFTLLGVEPGSALSEIKGALHRRSQLLRPHMLLGLSPADRALAQELLERMTEAFLVLEDDQLRARYQKRLLASDLGSARPRGEASADSSPLSYGVGPEGDALRQSFYGKPKK